MVLTDFVPRGRVVRSVGEIGGIVADKIIFIVEIDRQRVLGTVVYCSVHCDDGILARFQREFAAIPGELPDCIGSRHKVLIDDVAFRVFAYPRIVGVGVVGGVHPQAQTVQMYCLCGIVVDDDVFVTLIIPILR